MYADWNDLVRQEQADNEREREKLLEQFHCVGERRESLVHMCIWAQRAHLSCRRESREYKHRCSQIGQGTWWGYCSTSTCSVKKSKTISSSEGEQLDFFTTMKEEDVCLAPVFENSSRVEPLNKIPNTNMYHLSRLLWKKKKKDRFETFTL